MSLPSVSTTAWNDDAARYIHTAREGQKRQPDSVVEYLPARHLTPPSRNEVADTRDEAEPHAKHLKDQHEAQNPEPLGDTGERPVFAPR
jgi:hypothetical protein